MPSVVTLRELSKRPTKELMKMFYLSEKDAERLRVATKPRNYRILTSTDLDIGDMAEKLECSRSHVKNLRLPLRKVGFETLDRAGLTLPEDREFNDAVYRRLNQKPYLTAAFQLHEYIKYPSNASAFSKKLSILQRESEESSELYPELRIRKEVLSVKTRVRGKDGHAVNHRTVFGNLPCQPVYFLQKNIHKVGETIALEGDINSIVHRQSIPEDLRMAVSRASIKLNSKIDISKIYHALTKEPLKTRAIAEKIELKSRRIVDYLKRLEKLELAKETQEGFWVRAG